MPSPSITEFALQQMAADNARLLLVIENLREQNAALALNDARYQHLRDCTGHILAGIDPNENDGHTQWLDGGDLDREVDADIQRARREAAIARNRLPEAEFHDFRDRGDPLVKYEQPRPDLDLDSAGRPLRAGT